MSPPRGIDRLDELLALRDDGALGELEEQELVALLQTPDARRRLVAHQLLSTELSIDRAGRDRAAGDAATRRRRRSRPWLVAAGVSLVAGAAFALVIAGVRGRSPARDAPVTAEDPAAARLVERHRDEARRPIPPRFVANSAREPGRARAPTPEELAAARRRGLHAELSTASAVAVLRLRSWKPDANGLYVQNRESWHCAASQRYGLDTLIAGSVLGRADLVEEGWTTIDATFAHQRPDGGFGDAPVCAAVYLGQLAVALDTLEMGPLAAGNASRIAALTPALRRAASWLAQPAALAQLRTERPTTPTPDFAGASALASFAVRLENPALLGAALALADSGLSTQRPDGAFIHQGGPDSAYQMFRTLQLHWLLSTVPLPRYQKAARAAAAWLRARILPSGELDLTGNSTNKPCRPGEGSACRPPHFRAADLRWLLLLHAARFDESARPLVDRVYSAEKAAAQRPR